MSKLPRTCSECKKWMSEWYVIWWGEQYYCSDKCLHKNYSKEEWKKKYTDGGDNYWTQWEENDLED